jgi:hypothetical protein
VDGRGKTADQLRLNVPGCPEQSLTLTNRSPKKPLVRVAISEK